MILAAVSVLLGAAAQVITGFGFALIAGPALFAVLRPAEAVAALLVLGTTTNLLVLAGSVRQRSVRWAEVRTVTLAAVPGLVAGAVLLTVLPKAVLQVAIGLGVLAAVVPRLRGTRTRSLAGRLPPEEVRSRPRSAWPAIGMGVTVGLLTTSTGTNGPPLALWLERRRFGPREARDTIAAMFLALNVLGGLALVAVHRGAGDLLPPALGLLLAAELAGHLLGSLVFRRLGPQHFRLAGLLLAAASGVAGVVAGLTG